MTHTLINPNHLLVIPKDVAKCPKCGDELRVIQIDEWDTDGRIYSEDSLDIVCAAEPDDDDEAIDRFYKWHYDNPYVDWLPIEATVYQWFDAHYRVMDMRYADMGKDEIRTFWVKEPTP